MEGRIGEKRGSLCVRNGFWIQTLHICRFHITTWNKTVILRCNANQIMFVPGKGRMAYQHENPIKFFSEIYKLILLFINVVHGLKFSSYMYPNDFTWRICSEILRPHSNITSSYFPALLWVVKFSFRFPFFTAALHVTQVRRMRATLSEWSVRLSKQPII